MDYYPQYSHRTFNTGTCYLRFMEGKHHYFAYVNSPLHIQCCTSFSTIFIWPKVVQSCWMLIVLNVLLQAGFFKRKSVEDMKEDMKDSDWGQRFCSLHPSGQLILHLCPGSSRSHSWTITWNIQKYEDQRLVSQRVYCRAYQREPSALLDTLIYFHVLTAKIRLNVNSSEPLRRHKIGGHFAKPWESSFEQQIIKGSSCLLPEVNIPPATDPHL